MKAIKFIAMMIMAMTLSFSATSCSDDDDDNGSSINTDVPVTELVDNGSDLRFTINLKEAGVTISETMIFGYDKNEMITSYKVEVVCPNETTAKATEEAYKNGKMGVDIKSVTRSGKTVKAEMASSEFQGWTKQTVEMVYDEMRHLYGK
ncbi:MAG: hypothetical protein KBT20_09980 [Bacteroidales bacterium]|nr:hypothetical protein [Candidatus Liminaster caballi]